jgi:hypothetical protein
MGIRSLATKCEVGMNRHFQSGLPVVFFALITVSCISLLLYFTVTWADAAGPKRLANAQPGDCAACHGGGKQVIPASHQETKGMNLKDCMVCHEKDEVSLKSKMPTSHVHMLSRISCQKCHGEKTPFSQVDMKACITCHSIDGLAKAPAKEVNKPNPHNSHYGTDVDCSVCHHQHAKSEFMCAQCHAFSNVTPSPLAPLNFSSKAPEEKPDAP